MNERGAEGGYRDEAGAGTGETKRERERESSRDV